MMNRNEARMPKHVQEKNQKMKIELKNEFDALQISCDTLSSFKK